jgi:hypothetical protein
MTVLRDSLQKKAYKVAHVLLSAAGCISLAQNADSSKHWQHNRTGYLPRIDLEWKSSHMYLNMCDMRSLIRVDKVDEVAESYRQSARLCVNIHISTFWVLGALQLILVEFSSWFLFIFKFACTKKVQEHKVKIFEL